jgi:serine protease DegQ
VTRAPALLVLFLFVALVLPACTGEDEPAATGPAQASQTTTGSGAADTNADSSSSDGPGGLEDVPEIVQDVLPSVVAILVETEQGTGGGSGVIWSEDGTIVTNDHVVATATDVQVVFASGERVDAEVRATDPQTDLAIVQVDRDGLPPATFSDSFPAVGSLAIAMGSPLGFQNTVSAGIISGLHRILPADPGGAALMTDLIQTDAAISPGNSGGALVDGEGEVIGINEAYIPPSSGAVAIGFAIPAPIVTDTVEELIANGEASHAFLGIQPAPLTPQIAERFNIETETGVVVLDLVAGSAAEAAGLEPGDVIVLIGDREIAQVEDLFAVIQASDPGETVTVTVLRGGDRREFDVTFADRPPS